MAKKPKNKVKELRKGVSNIISSIEEKCNSLLTLAEDVEDQEFYNMVEEVTNKIMDVIMSEGDSVGQGAQELLKYIDGEMTDYYNEARDEYGCDDF